MDYSPRFLTGVSRGYFNYTCLLEGVATKALDVFGLEDNTYLRDQIKKTYNYLHSRYDPASGSTPVESLASKWCKARDAKSTYQKDVGEGLHSGSRTLRLIDDYQRYQTRFESMPLLEWCVKASIVLNLQSEMSDFAVERSSRAGSSEERADMWGDRAIAIDDMDLKFLETVVMVVNTDVSGGVGVDHAQANLLEAVEDYSEDDIPLLE